MKISRKMTAMMHKLFDGIIPPFLRDSRWFMTFIFRIVYKNKADVFLDFKSKAMKMSDEEFCRTYENINVCVDKLLSRESDLNQGCIDDILKSIIGNNVLDVGCGRCFLSRLMSRKHKVTGLDIVIDSECRKYKGISLREGNVEYLPFADRSFDTVVCAHTLEHVRHLQQAIKELRRVSRKRLIIIVPKQRPYKYTFDLHLHFFPYPESLIAVMAEKERKTICKEVDGDLFYMETAE